MSSSSEREKYPAYLSKLFKESEDLLKLTQSGHKKDTGSNNSPDKGLTRESESTISQKNHRPVSVEPARKIYSRRSSVNQPTDPSGDSSSKPPALTSKQWENELARFIVSMYATTAVQKSSTHDTAKSDALLAYVDEKTDYNQEISLSNQKSNRIQLPTITHRALAPSPTKNKMKLSRRLPESVPVKESVATLMSFRNVLRVKQRDGTEKMIRSPPSVLPIWFVASGDVHVEWTELPNGKKLQLKLDYLYEKHLFKDYLMTINEILENIHISIKLVSQTENISSSPYRKKTVEMVEVPNKVEIEQQTAMFETLWQRLIRTANAIAILVIEMKKFDDALDILNMALLWTMKESVDIESSVRRSLKGHVLNTFSFYFFRRHRIASARTHAMKALECHTLNNDVNAIASTYLDISAIEITLMKFKDAHKTLYEILTMLEEGKLALDTASPRNLCMVAIAYHNLAVVQLRLEVPDLACKSIQNARKIARLCLSYSNRWIGDFQRTHEAAVNDVKYIIATQNKNLDRKTADLFQQLVEDMYSLN